MMKMLTLEMHQRTKFSWSEEMLLSCRSSEESGGSPPQPRICWPGPRWAQSRCSGHTRWCSPVIFPVLSSARARQPRYQRRGSSLMVYPPTPRTHCSRSWRCCSWSSCPDPGRMSSSDQDPQHCHESGGWWSERWEHTSRTCTLSCYPWQCACRKPRGSPSLGHCTATPPSLITPASACHDSHPHPANSGTMITQ